MITDKLNPLGIASLILFITGIILSIYGYLSHIFLLIYIGGVLAFFGLIGSIANPYLKKNL